MRSSLLLWTSVLASIACQPPAPPEEATISADRTKLGFNQENNSGTFIGTSTPNSVLLKNIGLQDLTISGVNLTGDRFQNTAPDQTTLGFNESSIIQVMFTPLAPQRYSGTLTITSNSATNPTLEITLSGCGVDPNNVDLSYCEKSTDF